MTFDVVESSIMESGLAAAHPEIKTYAGRSEDGRATVRLDVTPMGFHAFVRGSRGGDAWFIDPAYNGDRSLYLSYLGDSLPAPERGLIEPDLDEVTGQDGLADRSPTPARARVTRSSCAPTGWRWSPTRATRPTSAPTTCSPRRSR